MWGTHYNHSGHFVTMSSFPVILIFATSHQTFENIAVHVSETYGSTPVLHVGGRAATSAIFDELFEPFVDSPGRIRTAVAGVKVQHD